jgi:prepilin-type N-terminal cleavage/methylation domain-containing protein
MIRRCNHPERRGPQAFSLLEMMMVLTLILLAASITQPIYQNIMLRWPVAMRGFFASLRMTASGAGGAARHPLHHALHDRPLHARPQAPSRLGQIAFLT